MGHRKPAVGYLLGSAVLSLAGTALRTSAARRLQSQLGASRRDREEGLLGLAQHRLARLAQDGVGVRVTMEAGGRRRLSERIGGGSYASAADPSFHFGLGSSQTVESVEVRWPSWRVDRHEHLAADTGCLLREGEVRARPLAGFPAAASGDSSSSMRRSKR